MHARTHTHKHTHTQDDFVLMCNNAMTYNGPETVYYAAAKNLLTVGIKIIAKVHSMQKAIVSMQGCCKTSTQ